MPEPRWLLRSGSRTATLARAFSLYVWAKEDDDVGALAGSRADERQKLVSLRSWALGGRLAMIAAFVGLTVAVAVSASWWWPFLAIFAVTGFGYLLGLSNYGIAQEEPADSSDPEQQIQSPASS